MESSVSNARWVSLITWKYKILSMISMVILYTIFSWNAVSPKIGLKRRKIYMHVISFKRLKIKSLNSFEIIW